MDAYLTLGELLESAAHRWPDHPFAAGGGKSLSYARFVERTASVAHGLAELGVTRGSRVAIMLPNQLEWLEVFFAAARMGAVATPVNPTYKRDEVARILSDSSARVLVTDQEHRDMAEALFDDCLTLRRIFVVGLAERGLQAASSLDDYATLRQYEPEVPDVAVASEDTVSLTYTSGTSGEPRGVLLSHANYHATAAAVGEAVGLDGDDRVFCALPFCHVGSQIVGPMAALTSGATVLVPPALPTARLAGAVALANASVLAAAPALLDRLARSPAEQFEGLDSLRLIVTTGAPLDVDTHQRLRARFDVPVITSYGLTEACGVSTVYRGDPADGVIGRPLEGLEMAVVDDQGGRRRDGAVGEVVVRGPSLMKGYLDDVAAAGRPCFDGWLCTGDLGFVDDDGLLHMVGRKKELIVRGGEHVHPGEIEEVLLRHPAIAEAGVVGLPDRAQGEEVAAFLVLADGHDVRAAEVLSYCGEHLANYKCPGIIEFRDALPKTATGRVRKAFLAQNYANGPAAPG